MAAKLPDSCTPNWPSSRPSWSGSRPDAAWLRNCWSWNRMPPPHQRRCQPARPPRDGLERPSAAACSACKRRARSRMSGAIAGGCARRRAAPDLLLRRRPAARRPSSARPRSSVPDLRPGGSPRKHPGTACRERRGRGFACRRALGASERDRVHRGGNPTLPAGTRRRLACAPTRHAGPARLEG